VSVSEAIRGAGAGAAASVGIDAVVSSVDGVIEPGTGVDAELGWGVDNELGAGVRPSEQA
jgi:hypothetical protein